MNFGSYPYVVRRLRFLRASGEPAEELERIAKNWARKFGHNWQSLLSEANNPGPADHHSELSDGR